MMAKKNKFPVFAFVVLVFSTFWLLEELNLYEINLPFLPVILIIASMGWIYNRFRK